MIMDNEPAHSRDKRMSGTVDAVISEYVASLKRRDLSPQPSLLAKGRLIIVQPGHRPPGSALALLALMPIARLFE